MNAEIFRVQNDPISMKAWVFERDKYTRVQVMLKYFTSRRYIFVVQCETLTIEATNKQEFRVVASFFFGFSFNVKKVICTLMEVM